MAETKPKLPSRSGTSKSEKMNENEILFIEPDEKTRNTISSYLQSAGYSVIPLSDPDQTELLFDSKPWNWRPWVIILEVVLPGMGGFELVRRIRERFPGQSGRILFLSKLYSTDDLTEAELAGADGYLAKPVKRAKLLSTIPRLFQRKSAVTGFFHDRGDIIDGPEKATKPKS